MRRALLVLLLATSVMARAEEAPLQLDDVAIVGNRERPRAVTLVPWRAAPRATLSGRPAGSVLDQPLAPLEREIFRRRIEYARAARAAEQVSDSAE